MGMILLVQNTSNPSKFSYDWSPISGYTIWFYNIRTNTSKFASIFSSFQASLTLLEMYICFSFIFIMPGHWTSNSHWCRFKHMYHWFLHDIHSSTKAKKPIWCCWHFKILHSITMKSLYFIFY